MILFYQYGVDSYEIIILCVANIVIRLSGSNYLPDNHHQQHMIDYRLHGTM